MASRRDLNYDDPFVERLRNLRKEHNYSFKELQALTGISSSSLQRYEKGIGANLPLSKLSLIAQAYNVSISYLMGCESKDLPRSQYEFITLLLEHEGFKITYHNETETFTLEDVYKRQTHILILICIRIYFFQMLGVVHKLFAQPFRWDIFVSTPAYQRLRILKLRLLHILIRPVYFTARRVKGFKAVCLITASDGGLLNASDLFRSRKLIQLLQPEDTDISKLRLEAVSYTHLRMKSFGQLIVGMDMMALRFNTKAVFWRKSENG